MISRLEIIVIDEENFRFLCKLNGKTWQFSLNEKTKNQLGYHKQFSILCDLEKTVRQIATNESNRVLKYGFLKPDSLSSGLLEQGMPVPDELKISEFQENCDLSLFIENVGSVFLSPVQSSTECKDAIRALEEKVDRLQYLVNSTNDSSFMLEVANIKDLYQEVNDKINKQNTVLEALMKSRKKREFPITTDSQEICVFDFKKDGETVFNIPKLKHIPSGVQSVLLRLFFRSGNEPPARFVNVTVSAHPQTGDKPIYKRHFTYYRYDQNAISFDNSVIEFPVEGYKPTITISIAKESVQPKNCHDLHLYVEGYYP